MTLLKTSFLRQPYPLLTSWRVQTLRLALVGTFVALFLIIFQPFGTEQMEMPHKNLFLAGYGLITFLTFSAVHIILPLLFPNYFNERIWTVGKQLLFILLPLSFTFLFCYVYLSWGINSTPTLGGAFQFYFMVLSIAFIPVFIVTLIDYLIKFKRNAQGAVVLTENLPQAQPANLATTIILKDEKEQTQLTIATSDFFFAKAANNYVEIYFQKEHQLQRELLRSSLAKIERQLTSPSFRRCHRSYLVHLTQILEVKGNAQGYQLYLKPPATTPIPLSRQRAKSLLAELPQ
ncbi:MAG: LytR/AlgR family response regulator transcription factor [Saprospiraceae bacterium]